MDAPGPAPTAPGPPPPNMLSRLLRPGGPPGATSPGGIIGAADPRPRSVRRSRCADIADMADIAAAALDAASGSGARAFAAFCDPGRPGKSPPRLGHPVLGGSANPFPAAGPRIRIKKSRHSVWQLLPLRFVLCRRRNIRIWTK